MIPPPVQNSKEQYMHGTAFRELALIEQPNATHRPYMEDSILIFHEGAFVIDCFLENCPKSALIGVFDGHGGDKVSRFLAKNIPTVRAVRNRL